MPRNNVLAVNIGDYCHMVALIDDAGKGDSFARLIVSDHTCYLLCPKR